MSPIKYRFYATLLDSFQYYLSKVDDDNAFQEFIDRLNRKPFYSKAAAKGSAFNELIDLIIEGRTDIQNAPTDSKGNIRYDYKGDEVVETFLFNKNLLLEISGMLVGAIPQKYAEAVLPTRYGNVLLYGYVDEILRNKVIDLKTTGRYTFPKFLNMWQKRVYPYCLNNDGIRVDTFEYLVTDFRNVYIEQYPYKPETDIIELQRFSEQLIDFIENNRSLIDSPKLFNREIAEAY